ncbi:MAG TPA: ComF family protein [Desulfobacterales bacterium]|nr:ComF family protein [Desulfobacterales bacterium]
MKKIDMIHFLQRLSQAFLHAIFPPRCLICSAYYNCRSDLAGTGASDWVSDLTAPYFCESCREGLLQIASPFCSRCGLPFVSREGDNHTCSECLLEKKYYRRARTFGVYDGSLMEAIHLLKYRKKTSLSRPLSALARETFLQFWDINTIDLLVSVPLHVKRLRERGFNQAHLLIRNWAKQDGIPLDSLTLSRGRWTEPQTTLSRAERRKNIKGAFTVRHPKTIKSRKVLLVDDVYTTGATVNECARVLMKAGAEFVDVLTLARAIIS